MKILNLTQFDTAIVVVPNQCWHYQLLILHRLQITANYPVCELENARKTVAHTLLRYAHLGWCGQD